MVRIFTYVVAGVLSVIRDIKINHQWDEQVSLGYSHYVTSTSPYGLNWYQHMIATQWYQFHTTEVWLVLLSNNLDFMDVRIYVYGFLCQNWH